MTQEVKEDWKEMEGVSALLIGALWGALEILFPMTGVPVDAGAPMGLILLALAAIPATALLLHDLPAGHLLRPILMAVILCFAGTLAAQGAWAQTLPAAEQWRWALPLVFLISWRAGVRWCQPRLWAIANFLLAAVLLAAARFLGGGHYLALRTSLSAASLLLAVMALSHGRAESRRRSYSLIVFAAMLFLMAALVSFLHEPTARWQHQHSLLTSPLAGLVRTWAPGDRVPATGAPGHREYFSSRLALETRQRLHDRHGRTRGVLLITVDAMRADLPGRRIKGRALTPCLDQLAQQGFRFSRAYSPAAISHWTFFSAFSGLLPSQIVGHGGPLDEVTLITDRLNSAGVKTRASFSTLVQGARSRRHPFTRFDFGFSEAHLYKVSPPLEDIIPRILPRPDEKRWFSFVHLMTPHAPYTPPADLVDGTGDEDRYHGEIRQADQQVAAIIEHFESRGLLDHSWVIISADHGEAFGEHGAFFHGANLYNEAIHVPLLILPPRQKAPAGGQVENSCVSLVDLAPTLEDLFDLKAAGRPQGYAGRSLLPLVLGIRDTGRANRALAEILSLGAGTSRDFVAVVTDRHKLILERNQKLRWLFDLQLDPNEQVNLIAQRPELASQLEGFIRSASLQPDDHDEFGRSMDILNSCELAAFDDVLKRCRISAVSSPRAALDVLAWLATSENELGTAALLKELEREANDEIRPGVELLSFRLAWRPHAFRPWFQRQNRSTLRMAGYYLASRSGLPGTPLPAASDASRHSLAERLAWMMYACASKNVAPPPGQVIQDAIVEALDSTSFFLHRLAFELVGISQLETPFRTVLEAEKGGLTLKDRLLMLKSLSHFERPVVYRRFLERIRHPQPEVRALVVKTWLSNRAVPEDLLRRESFEPPRPLPLKISIAAAEADRPLFMSVDNNGPPPRDLRVTCDGKPGPEPEFLPSHRPTRTVRITVPAGCTSLTLEEPPSSSPALRVHAWLIRRAGLSQNEVK